MKYRPMTLPAVVSAAGRAASGTPAAHADNKRLNDGVVANVYTVQHQAGCTNDIKINPQLQLAAEWHARDVLQNRNLNGDIGSDGSTPQRSRRGGRISRAKWPKRWRSIQHWRSAASR